MNPPAGAPAPVAGAPPRPGSALRGALAPYRRALALPRLGPLYAISFVARIPASAAAICLTLHVVLTLGHGYAAAGSVGAAATVGMAVGAPLLGRLVDRRGLRTMVVLTTVVEAVFWSVAPWLAYPALLVGAFLGGLLSLPVYSVSRQSIAAIVPAGQRRPAFALDSMIVELSYLLGPALGTVLALAVSTRAAMLAVGAGLVVAGIAFWLLDPPTRAVDPAEPVAPVRSPGRRRAGWLTPRLVGVLLATTVAAGVVFGSELAIIASLQTSGQAGTIPLVIGVWCLASLTGGLVYGALERSRSVFLLVGLLGALTVPVALGGSWWTFALLLIPAGLACAPSLTASADTVAELAPEHARGVVTGLQGSAITVGGALGAPLSGLVVDHASPAAAIALVGLVGAVGGPAAALLARARRADRGRLLSGIGHTGG